MLTYKTALGQEIQLGSAEGLKGKVREAMAGLEQLRTHPKGGADLTLRDYLALNYQTSPEHLYQALEIDPSSATVDLLLTGDIDKRWIVPEIFRDAIRVGLLKAPFYGRLIAGSQSIAQPSIVMPYTEISDAEPEKLGEAETIGVGSVSYGDKTVKVAKQGIGLQITYEAIRYSNLDFVAMFFQDMGIKLGKKLDKELVKVLRDGDQKDGSQSSAVVGVADTSKKVQWEDIVRVFVRLSLLGRNSTALIGNENLVNKLLNLPEIKNRQNPTAPMMNLTLESPLPQNQSIFVHNDMDDDQLMFIDVAQAAIQLTAAPLLVESEKIVQKQINGTYATITTGFANLFRDARVILDGDVAKGDNGAAGGFPNYMSNY